MICNQGNSFREFVNFLIMHEIRIAEDLSAIVLEVANRENLSKVTIVHISFGQMIQIVPHIFEFAFREIVRNSIADEAEIDIEFVPVEMKCSNCGNGFQVSMNIFSCNICGSTDLEIIHGKELFIKSIEGV